MKKSPHNDPMSDSPADRRSWTFLTNHARVLVVIARDPGVRLRDVAAACGVTERTVQAIVADLEAAGYLTHEREGRRNRYRLASGMRFRHPLEGDFEITGLLDLFRARPTDGGRLRGAGARDGGAGRDGRPDGASARRVEGSDGVPLRDGRPDGAPVFRVEAQRDVRVRDEGN
ncbi:helix-turn-helix transcriptional regulator [Streptomyces sp. NPDC058326]|uniref:helix-turn-helix transcriptional regulator n=1 Tax=Streptomyces sp. NPDC058326 TaxID=3346447 RepID=UPI0036E1A50C